MARELSQFIVMNMSIRQKDNTTDKEMKEQAMYSKNKT